MNTTTPSISRKLKRKPWSRETWIIIVSAILLAVFAVYAALNWFVIVDKEEWIGAKGEAVTNAYLALERTLVASGSKVRRSNKTVELENVVSTTNPAVPPIILLGDRRLAQMSADRVQMLANWVKAGGHLIVEAEQPSLEDPLLDYWGVERKRLVLRNGKLIEMDRRKPINEDDDLGAPNVPATMPDDGMPRKPENHEGDELKGEPKPNQSQPNNPPRGGIRGFNFPLRPKNTATRVSLTDNVTFSVQFQAYQNVAIKSLQHETESLERTLVRDENGGRIVEILDGAGRVTVISNFDFMTWKNLPFADNAELIWHLVSAGDSAKPEVVLAVHPQGDGFWKWMMENAWMVAFSALTLLLFWLWRVVPRFGPLLPPVSTARRSLKEHVIASGRFLVKREQWQTLVNPVRVRISNELKRRHPRTIAMTDAERLQYLSRLVGANEDDLARVLVIPLTTRRECLYAITHLLLIYHKLRTV